MSLHCLTFMIYVSFIFIVSNFHLYRMPNTPKVPQIKPGNPPQLGFFYNFKKVRIFQKSCNKPFHVSYKGNLYARMIFKIDHIPSSDGVRIYVHISDACLLPHIHTRNKVRSIICLRVKEEKKVTYNERSKATPITA